MKEGFDFETKRIIGSSRVEEMERGPSTDGPGIINQATFFLTATGGNQPQGMFEIHVILWLSLVEGRAGWLRERRIEVMSHCLRYLLVNAVVKVTSRPLATHAPGTYVS